MNKTTTIKIKNKNDHFFPKRGNETTKLGKAYYLTYYIIILLLNISVISFVLSSIEKSCKCT